jgi:DNA helicase IV
LSSQEIGYEQGYVSMLYEQLDALRGRAVRRLAAALRQTGGTPQARTERDATVTRYAGQLAQFDAGENGLCFGRLDFHDGDRRYVGRLGIFDESAEYEPLLVDWRAPAARPFYLATAAAPEGVRRRRQIRTSDRRVVGVQDEVLDLSAPSAGGREGLTSEAALLAAVSASRTGRMGDIVETIQAEQDRVIRSDHRGVLVVQGGPGTGKTAVALHRAAYLLYTYREQLSKRGVLIVGPNSTFLRYIGQVLPSLGETGAVLSTVGDLFPGVRAGRAEPEETAEVKGRAAMVEVLAAAVRDRQRVPGEAVEIVTGERETVRLEPAACQQARERARRSGRRHNDARPVFVDGVIDALARQVADEVGGDILAPEGPLDPAVAAAIRRDLGEDPTAPVENLLDEADLEEIRRELRGHPAVLAAIDELWPRLTPQQMLADLYASPQRLATAAPQLTDAERAGLVREPGGGWTVADVPLLDEAADLLGGDEQAAVLLARRRRRERETFAQGVLEILSRDLEDDPEILMAYDMLDAELLAERHEDDERLTVAELAAADRRWAYGHVIVDEAQELSTMAWRMLMRRCPSRSMTLVGDVAQTGDPGGASSWAQVLQPYLADRWRLARLTVNYRTPAEIMEVAADVAPRSAERPRSVRWSGLRPWRERVAPQELAGRVAAAAAREAERVGDGRVAVIAPVSRVAALRSALRVPAEPDLAAPVTVLGVRQAKGLEFDSVLVVDPDRILGESPRGRNDLYVAMTRATQRLGVLHTGAAPAVLRAAVGGGDVSELTSEPEVAVSEFASEPLWSERQAPAGGSGGRLP